MFTDPAGHWPDFRSGWPPRRVIATTLGRGGKIAR
jgi:hypothetical protein